jgi:hypothetical protein
MIPLIVNFCFACSLDFMSCEKEVSVVKKSKREAIALFEIIFKYFEMQIS